MCIQIIAVSNDRASTRAAHVLQFISMGASKTKRVLVLLPVYNIVFSCRKVECLPTWLHSPKIKMPDLNSSCTKINRIVAAMESN